MTCGGVRAEAPGDRTTDHNYCPIPSIRRDIANTFVGRASLPPSSSPPMRAWDCHHLGRGARPKHGVRSQATLTPADSEQHRPGLAICQVWPRRPEQELQRHRPLLLRVQKFSLSFDSSLDNRQGARHVLMAVTTEDVAKE